MSKQTKKNRLIARAQATTRQPRPPANAPPDRPGYRIVPVSLYVPQVLFIDHTTDILKGAGSPKANRSLVVREAILRLQEQLQGKNAEEVLRDFTDHQARRNRLSGSY